MKKLLATLSITLVAAGAFAQGYVTFANVAGTQVSTNSGMFSNDGSVGGTGGFTQSATTGGRFYYGLFVRAYGGSTNVPQSNQVWNESLWTYTGAFSTNTTAGRFSVGSTQVPGWSAGQLMEFCIAGWSASLGNAASLNVSDILAQARANAFTTPGFFGVSGVSYGTAQAAPPTPSFPLFGTTGASAQGLPLQTGFSMYVVPVPEPSTFALAGLGAAAMLIFRRRK